MSLSVIQALRFRYARKQNRHSRENGNPVPLPQKEKTTGCPITTFEHDKSGRED